MPHRSSIAPEKDEETVSLNLQTLIVNLPGVLLVYDLDGNISFITKQAAEVLSYQPEEMLNRRLLEFVSEEERSNVTQRIQRRLDEGLRERYETVLINKKGERRYFRLNTAPFTKDGEIKGGILLAEDITEQKVAEKALRESEQLLASIINFLPDATFAINREGQVIAWNHAIARVTGVPAEQMLNRGDHEYSLPFYGIRRPMLLDIVLDPDLEVKKDYHFIEMKGDTLFGEGYIQANDESGRLKSSYYWGKASRLYDSAGQIIGAIETFRDLNERKENEERLKYLSLHDALTGIFNRAHFEAELQRLESGPEQSVGLLICDLDGLKPVNDSLGHGTGDALLIAAARVLQKCIRQTDILARIGGDEFAMLLPQARPRAVEKVYHRLQEAIADYNRENPKLPLSLSVGYAAQESVRNLMGLYQAADNKMYQEKMCRSQSSRSLL